MTIELLGGLALFLYGMEKMTDGLKAATGKQMNTLLAKLTGNPVLGAITGAIVTAQPSPGGRGSRMCKLFRARSLRAASHFDRIVGLNNANQS
jgi:hypothetical protein